MHGMEYPPGEPIRPDIIRPAGVNPGGKTEKPLWFFHFSRSAVPSSFSKGTWTRRICHPVKYAGQTLIIEVDRDVLIAIARPEYRAGTARSTLSEFQSLFVIGISQNAMSLGEPVLSTEAD
jgi:hypothetical protein